MTDRAPLQNEKTVGDSGLAPEADGSSYSRFFAMGAVSGLAGTAGIPGVAIRIMLYRRIINHKERMGMMLVQVHADV